MPDLRVGDWVRVLPTGDGELEDGTLGTISEGYAGQLGRVSTLEEDFMFDVWVLLQRSKRSSGFHHSELLPIGLPEVNRG